MWGYLHNNAVMELSVSYKRPSFSIEKVLFPSFFVFFDVKTKLSFTREKLWLIFVDLAISKDVVNKTGERKTRFCSGNANCSDKETLHGSFNEVEDVFHTASPL